MVLSLLEAIINLLLGYLFENKKEDSLELHILLFKKLPIQIVRVKGVLEVTNKNVEFH